MMACDVWKLGVHFSNGNGGNDQQEREKPDIEMIITFWHFFVRHNKEKS
jgi:hypothetical protein